MNPTTPASLRGQPLTIHNKIQRDSVTFLRRTDGQLSTLVRVELAPGGGNPPHRHSAYAETFTARQGTLGLHLDGRELRLQSGETATAPIGSVHRFYNPTDEPVVFEVEIQPGHRGFERGLIVLYGLANDNQTDAQGRPRHPLHLGLFSSLTDTRLIGPLAALNPVMTALGWLARVTGTQRRLLVRYDR